MKLHVRLVRFLWLSAYDLLMPDIIAKPISLAVNFHQCFLVTEPAQRLALLGEVRSLSEPEMEGVVDALAAEWRSHLPKGQLTSAQRELLRQLVRSLRAESLSGASASPGDALRRSLNESLLRNSGHQLRASVPTPEQMAVGRSMVEAGLSGKGSGLGPRPLPSDAPQIPGHKLLQVLGDGGFSVVYLAAHEATGELRAVKVGPLKDKGRFEREVRTLGKLKGPHIVQYREHGEWPGHFWIAMEYLGGFTLTDLISTRPSTGTALILAEQILRGLDSLHQAGIIHRDLKPDNIMVDPEFRLKLIDFGLAKPAPGVDMSHTMSMTAGLVGTPRYMSREQILESASLTQAADLWAFGCIVVEMLTGRPLFESNNIMALGHEIMTKEVRVDAAGIPPELRPFLQRCLAQDVARRWLDAQTATPEFSRLAGETRRRLRHEHYQGSWGVILEKGLLERFAAEHKGRLPTDGPGLFATFAKSHGIPDVDKARLAEVLGPISASQERVQAVEQQMAEAKVKHQQEYIRLTADEMTQRAASIRKMEDLLQTRQREVQLKVRELLAAEVQSWEDNQRVIAEKKAKQAAEELRLKQERDRREQEQARLKAQEAAREEAERVRLRQEAYERERRSVRLAAEEEARKQSERQFKRQEFLVTAFPFAILFTGIFAFVLFAIIKIFG